MASSRPESCEKAAPADAQVPGAGASAGVDAAKDRDSAATGPRWAQLQKAALKLPQETKDCPCTEGRNQPGGNAEVSLGLSRDLLLSAAAKGSPGPRQSPCQTEGLHSAPAEQPRGSALASEGGGKELEGPSLPLEGRAEAKQGWITTGSKPTLGESCSSGSPGRCSLGTEDRGCTGEAPEGRPRSNASSCFQGHQHREQLEPRASLGQREEEQQQQRVTEATVCAKNSKVSSTGEKVVLWTRYFCLTSCIFLCSLFSSSSYWILYFVLYPCFLPPPFYLCSDPSPSVWPCEQHWLLLAGLLLEHFRLGKNLFFSFKKLKTRLKELCLEIGAGRKSKGKLCSEIAELGTGLRVLEACFWFWAAFTEVCFAERLTESSSPPARRREPTWKPSTPSHRNWATRQRVR